MLCSPQLNFFRCQLCPAARHDALGSAGKSIKFMEGPLVTTAPRKTWNVLRLEATPEDVAPFAHHRAGVEHRIDAAFAVVAHEHTAKLEPAVGEVLLAFIPKPDGSVVALEVAGVRVGP